MIYIVAYSLNPRRDVSSLLTELQKPPAGWCHYLDETWLIATSETATQLHDRLRLHLVQTDYVIVVQMKPDAEYYGWLPKEAWDWIEQHKNG